MLRFWFEVQKHVFFDFKRCYAILCNEKLKILTLLAW